MKKIIIETRKRRGHRRMLVVDERAYRLVRDLATRSGRSMQQITTELLIAACARAEVAP